jgi:PAS domain S-box-containing protein
MDEAGSVGWFSAEQRAGLEDFWRVFDAHAVDVGIAVRRKLSLSSPLGAALHLGGSALVSRLDFVFFAWGSAAARDFAGLEDALTGCEQTFAQRAVGFESWVEVCLAMQAELLPLLCQAYGADPARLRAVLDVQQRYAALLLRTMERSARATAAGVVARAEATASLASARFNSLAESGMLGVLICDYMGNIVEANDGFLATFGYDRADLLSGRVQWSRMTPSEWSHLDDRAIEQLRVSGKARPWEKEYFHKDGSRVPVLVGVATLNDSQTIAFVLDISERKRLEEVRARSAELEAQNRRIQEASRLKSEFLANMSHELRTPLNSIIGFAELLHDREVDPSSPQYLEFLQDILRSGRHLQQMINDVLDLAKVEAGKMELRPERVNVAQLIGEVSNVLRGVAATKHIRVEATVQPEVGQATLDPSRFKQVLYNYLSNALKFTPEGGSVRVAATREQSDMLCLTVEDSGIGIAEGDLGRLFVDFQQLEEGATKKHGGTGLGLALTKRLVEAQGGSVGVKSQLGKGSQFFALLPLHAPLSAGALEHVALGMTSGASAVLVVEDDARDRNLIIQALARSGYGVEAVGSGGQAIAACAERSFDAITLDLLLPDMTGLDVLHRIRTEGKNRETPVVVVSVVAERGILAGFSVQDYLVKPVNGRDLLQAFSQARIPPRKGGKILIVDDDPAAQRLMAATLEDLGYEIQASADGAEALAFTKNEQPLAVVLDLVMPNLDGLEFLMRFREAPDNRAIPVIVWTMKDLSADDVRRLRMLAQSIVGKNEWRPSTFIDEIRGLISATSIGGAA